MFLRLYETAVSPPSLQLFDHAVAGVQLIGHHVIVNDRLMPDAPVFFWVTMGTVLSPQAVSVCTQSCRLASLPGYQEVYRRWISLRQRFEDYQDEYIDALLKCIWHFGRLQVEFRLRNDRIRFLRVRANGLSLVGRIPDSFDQEDYFGESSKLADSA